MPSNPLLTAAVLGAAVTLFAGTAARAGTDLERFQNLVDKTAPVSGGFPEKPKFACQCLLEGVPENGAIGAIVQQLSSGRVRLYCYVPRFNAAGDQISTFGCGGPFTILPR